VGSTRTFNTERGDVLLLKLAGKMSLDKRRLEHTSATGTTKKAVDGEQRRAANRQMSGGVGYLSRASVADEDEFEGRDLG
jgi:hypothetical protein